MIFSSSFFFFFRENNLPPCAAEQENVAYFYSGEKKWNKIAVLTRAKKKTICLHSAKLFFIFFGSRFMNM